MLTVVIYIVNRQSNSAQSSVKSISAADKKDPRSEIYLTRSTPVVAALRHINRLIEEVPLAAPKTRFIKIRGLGKAIDQAIIVAVRLQQQGHSVSFHTGTVTVVDEGESNQIAGIGLGEDLGEGEREGMDNPAADVMSTAYLQGRKVSSMEIRVHLRR